MQEGKCSSFEIRPVLYARYILFFLYSQRGVMGPWGDNGVEAACQILAQGRRQVPTGCGRQRRSQDVRGIFPPLDGVLRADAGDVVTWRTTGTRDGRRDAHVRAELSNREKREIGR